jgi:hypothetical protein
LKKKTSQFLGQVPRGEPLIEKGTYFLNTSNREQEFGSQKNYAYHHFIKVNVYCQLTENFIFV